LLFERKESTPGSRLPWRESGSGLPQSKQGEGYSPSSVAISSNGKRAMVLTQAGEAVALKAAALHQGH
jgi:hypothetical protein